MWWQGEENCPEIVKMCRESLRRNSNSHKIILITKDNYQDYLSLPDHIISKVNSGRITLTHLSDIIRAGLLAKYGGLWIDSTVFVAGRIPEEVFSLSYFTLKRTNEKLPKSFYISAGRWTGYLFAVAYPGTRCFCFIYDMFLEYWKTHDSLTEYLLIDFLIALAFDEFQEFRDEWQNIPINNTMLHELEKCLDDEYDSGKYSEICASTYFFKLTYKKDFRRENDSGSETFYGHLLSEHGIS